MERSCFLSLILFEIRYRRTQRSTHITKVLLNHGRAFLMLRVAQVLQIFPPSQLEFNERSSSSMCRRRHREKRGLSKRLGDLRKKVFKLQFDGEREEGKPDKSPKPDDLEENVGCAWEDTQSTAPHQPDQISLICGSISP